MTSKIRRSRVVRCVCCRISDNPAEVVPGCDIVVITAPAMAHGPIMRRLAPHVSRGTWVGCLFAQGGFDWAARAAFGSKLDDGTVPGIFGLANIPWINIKTEYGRSSKIAGPKDRLFVAASPPSQVTHAAALMSELFDIPCGTVANFLSMTLTPSNQIIHPARYYAIFKDWDGSSSYDRADVPAKLYGSFDTEASEHLSVLDNELQQVKLGLLRRYPALDLSVVIPIKQRIEQQYGAQVGDKKDLRSVMATNQGYAPCNTPVAVQPDGRVKPAVASRLFWEDMPFGLVILKDLAQMMDIPTPRIDRMLEWHQQFMGKKYVVDVDAPAGGRLNPAELDGTGAPRAYGLRTLDAVVAGSLPDASARSRL